MKTQQQEEVGGTSPTFTTMGIDIGQKRDPTAIAVAEIGPRTEPDAQRPDREKRTTHFLVRFLERLPLGTPYPRIARRVGELCRRVAERTGRQPTVFVDATGVGAPVVDLLEEEMPSSGSLWSVFFTYGDRRTEDERERRVTLGKALLVSRLQTLLQARRIHLPRNPESGALVEELLDYEVRVDQKANERYGAFKVGTHDDLVTALGLAVQRDRGRVSVYPGGIIVGRY